MNTKNILIRGFEKTKVDMATYLPEVSTLELSVARHILAQYTAALEKNFILWLAATVVSVRSVQARFASEENLLIELQENHPAMLHQFACSAGALPIQTDFEKIEGSVSSLTQMVQTLNGLQNLTLMATLENTSLIFIPFLRSLAEKCGSLNFEYTDIHGIADQDHAEQFLWALEYEIKEYQTPLVVIERVQAQTLTFLKQIFEVKSYEAYIDTAKRP